MSDALDEAVSWAVSQIRGNNAESDAKVTHRICALVEEHFSLAPATRPGAFERLKAVTAHADEIGPVGRGLVWLMWMWRVDDGMDDHFVWKLLREAQGRP